jgi:3' terminal RNA ribose 2'-O-methyltransferase Hen1
MLPCRGGAALPERLFEPLGYEVHVEETALLDEQFPEWGNSPYINLTIRGKVRLRDMLNHMYVLIPVFDRQKHYWIGESEVDKLLNHGKGWLPNHPEKALIARRYFKNLRNLERTALDRLDNGDGEGATEAVPLAEDEPAKMTGPKLNDQRLEAALNAIKKSGAESVIDLGCGEGNLLRLLMKEKTVTRIAGVDVSRTALEHARDKLNLERLPEARQQRVSLLHGSVTYRDKRFRGYDAAALVEVIEHLDEARLDTLAAVVWGDARPGTLALTTPNSEYNEIYDMSRFRHGDHRFEWNRARFQSWAEETARRYGYTVSFEGIGESDEKRGAPTQMAVFVLGNIPGNSQRSFPCI